jgi:two-component system, NarL family, sensor histidine kinase DesK
MTGDRCAPGGGGRILLAMRLRLLPPEDRLGWAPYLWLCYLGFLGVTPALDHGLASTWAWTAASAAVFLPLYFLGYHARPRGVLMIVGSMFALGALLSPINPGATVYLVYASAFVGRSGNEAFAWRLLTVLVIATALLVWSLRIYPGFAYPTLAMTALLGATNIRVARLRRLRLAEAQSRSEAAALATADERERIARDLHDLLGHSLSLMILKGELASRLTGGDAGRAREEIDGVVRVARDALTEVRDAVRGYRNRGLAAELAGARSALESAGTRAEVTVAAPELPPEQELALAFAVREGVTNVVRHASAEHCAIRLGADGERWRLTIEDDGRGATAPEGSGLTGMRERLERLGGTVERTGGAAGVGRGTRLTITIPRVPGPAGVDRG